MQALTWQLEKRLARLRLGQLVAAVDPAQPQKGLVEVSVGAWRLPGAQLLAVAGASFPPGEENLGVETCVRGADLVSAYPESANRPVRVDARWRAVSPAPSEQFLAAVELVVSVQTHVRQRQPELSVRSSLPATETFRLLEGESLSYQKLAPPPEAPAALGPEEGTGCLLFRQAGMELSYAQMVHPADFHSGRLVARSENEGTMHVSDQLFSQALEKGVILRARVRGVFLPRSGDQRIAAACYAAFAEAEPPLST